MYTKEQLLALSHEKVVDILIGYINKDEQRKEKQSTYHKMYNEKKKIELEEFRRWKNSK